MGLAGTGKGLKQEIMMMFRTCQDDPRLRPAFVLIGRFLLLLPTLRALAKDEITVTV